MVDPNVLINLIKQKQSQIATASMSAPFVDHASYREAVGQHQGLEIALDLINYLLDEEKNDGIQQRAEPSKRHAYG
jgi:hypothetical protein